MRESAWVVGAALAAVLAAVLAVASATAPGIVQRGWRPSIGLEPFKPYITEADGTPTAAAVAALDDTCALYKVAFNQELYFQYVQYKTSLPDMLQLTLCTWVRFSNHSNDHPLFSYAVPDQPRAILSWVANSKRSSYLSFAINGHTFYRLNYPFRLHRWYHACQSWNGKTGEWQAWVNAERVGRGFHNRLVGHVIPGGGVALSGQEQRQVGGGFLEGPGAPAGAGGMLGEITLLHLYAAALAPGKAHRDHKHHHGNHFESNPANGQSPNAGAQPSTPAPVPQFDSPYLVNGQLAPTGLHIAAQLAGLSRPGGSPNPAEEALLQSFPGVGAGHAAAAGLPVSASAASIYPAGVLLQQHTLFKRNEDVPSGSAVATTARADGAKTKRQITPVLNDLGLPVDYNPLSVPEDVILAAKQRQQQDDYPREPAEGEVMQVMNVCSGCAREPFKKVELISWRHTPKKLYSGALYTPATPVCRKF